MSKRIQVVVSPTGATTIKATGFTGAECKDATKSLVAALGTPKSDSLSAEYYQSAIEPQHQQRRS